MRLEAEGSSLILGEVRALVRAPSAPIPLGSALVRRGFGPAGPTSDFLLHKSPALAAGQILGPKSVLNIRLYFSALFFHVVPVQFLRLPRLRGRLGGEPHPARRGEAGRGVAAPSRASVRTQ